jgi:internalin A
MISAEGRDSVRKEIERARHDASTYVNLAAYRVGDILEEIPDEVFSYPELEHLILSDHRIQEIPERVRELPKLKYLGLEGNPIKKVADIPGLNLDWPTFLNVRDQLSEENVHGISILLDDAGDLVSRLPEKNYLHHELRWLPNLRRLTTRFIGRPTVNVSPSSSSELRNLLVYISDFSKLESLQLRGISLQLFPGGIRALKQLRSLQLQATDLREVPDWISELEELELLSLPNNRLTVLPESLATLTRLALLDLDDNPFTEIPKVVFRLPQLETLFIGTRWPGSIKQVPGEILKAPKLLRLDVGGQPIEVPPQEVVNKGLEAIRNYWRQQQEVGVDYLCEAKLIILGEAGAGKTTLAKKIKDPQYNLKPQEPSTEGIDVVRWSFPAAVRVRDEDGREKVQPSEFKASIWDFGGQEIYHATHQFFLTRRSLYALVADDRKEDTDFNYWLQAVELLSDGSPLLIVQNEKQDRQRDIDLGTLRAHFPNLLGETFRTNLADNRGLDRLTTAIRQELERLPHIGTPLPKTWSQVRSALEGDPRHYISLNEYLSICEANGFTRREDKLQLSGYLHDLGICLHFQDDPVLKNTVILKPKWGTDAVYAVLDDHGILNNRGRFNQGDLARIWSDPAYADMHDELLRLMMRFKLCYPIADMEAYIAPQLLSPTRPEYEWMGEGGLVVRYDYDFMPKGILTRFIVAVHHLIADQELVWKSGVILSRQGTRAEVIEDYPRRKITVRVTGADTRGLLAIVDDQLERIHASFPRLKYERFLPCNCHVCSTREEPYAYPLSELKDFAEHEAMIQCRTSRKLVDAANLIRDVLPSAARSMETEAAERHLGRVMQEIVSAEPVPREVFVSYAWTDESTQLVDKLQDALACHDIALLRDKDEIKYKDSIRDFMERIGRGKCIVVVLSKKYLESKNCMFELTEIAERGDIRDRVFPVVLPDSSIYNALSRVQYVKYWEQKKTELDAAMKGVSGENLEGIRDELDLYAHVRSTIARITDILGDMNALSLDEHQGSRFSTLIQALQERLEA